MKKLLFICFTLLLLLSCKQKTHIVTTEHMPEKVELTTAQKIANAHGFEQWKNVTEISFTFRDKRHWIWKPKTNDVTLITDNDTITYNRKQLDSLVTKTDKAFVNDKYWLLIPFQLIWDKDASISKSITKEAPISKKPSNKITLNYPNNGGGYTPGDAYDIYFDNDYIIREWAFRKSNEEKPSLINTFENYQDFKGIKIALEHKKEDAEWNLLFSNIQVVLEK